jgi:hypothetical protein
MRVFGSPWRELQVLTQNLAMASEILAMASSAGHEISPWQVNSRHGKISRTEPVYFEKFSNRSFYVRMQFGFHEYV